MRAIRSVSRDLAAVLLGCWLAVAPLSAEARDPEPEGAQASALVNIGAGLCTFVYAPVKLVYALTGTVLSGMAWMWTGGDGAVAGTILRSSIRGDYVIVAAHLGGGRPLEFLGPQY